MSRPRTELQRMQNRESPKLLAGSPPSDDFSSLLSTCVKPEESTMNTERTEPQISACVQAYKLQMKMQKHFVHEQPKNSTSWRMPEIQSLASDPRVYSFDGPMCRWSMKARISNNKEEFMRKQTGWLTSSKEIADVPRGDGRWTRVRRHVHMTGKSGSARVSCVTCGSKQY